MADVQTAPAVPKTATTAQTQPQKPQASDDQRLLARDLAKLFKSSEYFTGGGVPSVPLNFPDGGAKIAVKHGTLSAKTHTVQKDGKNKGKKFLRFSFVGDYGGQSGQFANVAPELVAHLLNDGEAKVSKKPALDETGTQQKDENGANRFWRNLAAKDGQELPQIVADTFTAQIAPFLAV